MLLVDGGDKAAKSSKSDFGASLPPFNKTSRRAITNCSIHGHQWTFNSGYFMLNSNFTICHGGVKRGSPEH